jgi:O-antigen ligase
MQVRDSRTVGKLGQHATWFGLFFLASGGACAMLIIKPVLGIEILVAGTGACVLAYLFATALEGRVEPLILTWVLIFPLGYYFLSFPREQSIITLDRVLPLVLPLAISFGSPQSSDLVPRAIRPCAIAWTIFIVIAGASLVWSGNALTSGRLLGDGFCLPALLGWGVIRNFNVRRYAGALHVLVSMMVVYVAGIGAAEMVLKEDLLPLQGSALFFAGSLPRPNGPFYTNDSFAIIGLVALFLLLFLRSVLPDKLGFWRVAIHAVGVTASLAMGLMPMFRSVFITLLLILLLATLSTRKLSLRIAGFALLLACSLSVCLFSLLAPDAYEDRSNPDNFYVRLAEQMQTLQVFSSHPVLGVGLGRFTDVVGGDSRYLGTYHGIQSIDSPHNNLGGILAETGLLGFIPYVAAQVLLVSVFWGVRKRGTRDSQLAWTYFLSIFLCYWINGMTLASGYASDLNLWFIFAIAILYKYSITEKAEAISPGPVDKPSIEREYEYAYS